MKIRSVASNARKQCFVIQAGSATYDFPFSELSVVPTPKDPVAAVWIDKELGNQGLSYSLQSGKTDSLLLEQVLAFHEDPEYLREQLLYRLTMDAQRILKKRKLSKRALARRLKTSPMQLYRLLDQTFYGKTIDQMVKLLYALGHTVEISSRQAA